MVSNPVVDPRRTRIGYATFVFLTAGVLATAAFYAICFIWAHANPLDYGIVIEVPLFASIGAGFTGVLMGFAALLIHRRSGIGGGLRAALPAFLVPLAIPLAEFLVSYVGAGAIKYPLASNLIANLCLYGTVVWILTLLDSVLPRWGGAAIGMAILLGLALFDAWYFWRNEPWGAKLNLLVAGQLAIRDFVPVFVSFAAAKLLFSLSRIGGGQFTNQPVNQLTS